MQTHLEVWDGEGLVAVLCATCAQEVTIEVEPDRIAEWVAGDTQIEDLECDECGEVLPQEEGAVAPTSDSMVFYLRWLTAMGY